jgi:hypothetical protein
MATKAKNELKELRDERYELRQRVNTLERIVARIDSSAILCKLPDPLEEYTDDLPSKLLALSVIGLATAELRAELGMSKQQQRKWRNDHPAFSAALLRAKDLSLAYWQRLSRQALEAKDWKFPYSQAQRFIEAMLHEDDGDMVDRGDASKLVILHKYPPPSAR